jgi:hypothetical protein
VLAFARPPTHPHLDVRPRFVQLAGASFHSAFAYPEDLDTFRDGEWLSDAAVLLWIERLVHETWAGRGLFDGGGGVGVGVGGDLGRLAPPVAFVHPSAVHLSSLLPDPADYGEAIAALRVPERSLVLFPVNDSADPLRAQSGSHWSLLALWPRGGAGSGGGGPLFVHFDSSPGSNDVAASRFAAAVWAAVGGGAAAGAREGAEDVTSAASATSGSSSSSSSSSSAMAARLAAAATAGTARRPRVIRGRCSAQANGFDCGVHAMLAAGALVARAAADASASGSDERPRSSLEVPLVEDVAEHTSPAAAVRARREMRAWAEALGRRG